MTFVACFTQLLSIYVLRISSTGRVTLTQLDLCEVGENVTLSMLTCGTEGT